MNWRGALLALVRDDRVALLGVGLVAYGVMHAMVAALTMIRDENEITPEETKTQYITQETEDSLRGSTLTKLLEHPNFSIRDIAIKILCDRAANDPATISYLLYGITLKSYDERLYCLRALSLMKNQTLVLDGYTKLNTPEAYSALIRSLEQSLDDGELAVVTNVYWDEFHTRDTAEKFCLQFLQDLTAKYGVNQLIKGKFVENWLAKQNWGSEAKERQQNFRSYVHTRNNKIVEIINRIMQSKRGLRALEKAELLDREYSKRRVPAELPGLMVDVGNGIGELPPTDMQLRRAREHSAEERRLRRQHREAMVLNDGTRPLAREDIFERDHGSPT